MNQFGTDLLWLMIILVMITVIEIVVGKAVKAIRKMLTKPAESDTMSDDFGKQG